MEEQYSNMPSSNSTAKPYMDTEGAPSAEQGTAEPAVNTETTEAKPGHLLADSLEQGKNLLNEHKGKLAIGVAATLGLMVFYKWRDKKLAQEDPEEYARLQRLKAVVRADDANLGNEKPSADNK